MFNADEIFLDNNATTRPLPQVQQAMNFAMNEGFGNPSSSHRGGEIARRIVTCARDDVAGLIGANPNQILFTSGATESNNWVFYSVLSSSPKPTFVTTNVEHSSVKELVENNSAICPKLVQLQVRNDGLVDLAQLRHVCSSSPTLISIQWVNNETGVIQPIEQIAAICRNSGALLHVDGSQAVGKLPVDVSQLKIDFLTFTAHKFHGPQGIGAIYCRRPSILKPLLYGGGQESGLRPGTENLPGIAGFGKAAEIRRQNFEVIVGRLSRMRDEFEHKALASIPNTYINGAVDSRVCNTSNLRFEGVDGQALVAQLDAAGIRCSQGSACTAQIPEPSYVLRAMGFSEENAYSSVRFSFSELNTFEEIDKVVAILTERVKALRDFDGTFKTNQLTETSNG